MTAPSDPPPLSRLDLTATPAPVLLNGYKHHVGFLRERCAACADAAPGDATAGLAALADELLVVGSALMDWYTGERTVAEIATQVLDRLRADERLDQASYHAWIEASGAGYRTITFTDQTVWCLRSGRDARAPERYVHVHPGRWTPETLRVRANTLKTAALAVCLARYAPDAAPLGDPESVEALALVNEARDQVGLDPLRALTEGDRLPAVLAALSGAK